MKLLVRCWWISLVVLAACFSPQFDDGQIKCGPNDECPPGLECFGGVCRTGDPGVDAATGFPLTITLGGNMMGTVTSAPAGITCGADCMETFPSGTMVTLTATPNSGATFVGWSGACSGTGACTITVATAINVTANFAVDNSLVVAHGGNGSGIVSSNPAGINCGSDCMEAFAPNTMVMLTASPATGSTFDGWSGGGCTGTGTCMVTADVAKMVTATFSLTQHSLTVVLAGTGSGTVASNPTGIDCGSDCSESYPYNTMVTLTATPATGSTFAGWTGGGCSGTGTCQVTMTQASAVTATFTLTTHMLTVVKVGAGTVTSSPTGINCGTGAACMSSFAYNTMVTLSATPAAGSTFTGWSGGVCSGTSSCMVTITQATTVTATFTLNKYSLGVLKDSNGDGTVTSNIAGITCGGDCTQDYDFGTMVTLDQSAAPGSTFTGWSGACSGTGSCVVTVDAAKTVTATFTLSQHPLSVLLTGTGTGTVSGIDIDCHAPPNADCSGTYNYNSVVTLTASAAAGSTFAGWSGGVCTGTGTCEVTMTQMRAVTAQFTLNTYLLSVAPAGTGTGAVTSNDVPKGIDCGDDCNQIYGHGTAVTLTATPTTGSLFTGWTGCTSSSGTTCNVTMSAAKSVTATFTITTNLLTATIAGAGSGTVTSNLGSINCPGDCSDPYTYGTIVTLTATPGSGSIFTGWSGTAGCTGSATSCQVTMDAAKTATATFATATNGLTVSKSGTGAGTVTSNDNPQLINCGTDCSENYLNGTVVTLTATPTAGSVFSGWSGVAGCSTSPMCTVTLTAATTVSATFTLNVHTLSVTKNGTGTGTVTSIETPPKIDCGTDCSEPYNHGTNVRLSATPSGDSIFTGWSGGGCTGTGTCVVTVDMAKTVTATFDKIQHNLHLKVADGGKVTSMPMGIDCGIDCDELYNDSQVVMLLATPDPGYSFVGWADGCTGTSTMCSVTMNGDVSVYAEFAPAQYTLTINRMPVAGGDIYSIDDPGIDCGTNSCSAVYNYGTKVPLKVSPASGYTFTGWGGACSGTGDCEPTMDADKTVTASFVLTTYTLNVNRAGNGSGSVVSTTPGGINCGADCDHTYNDGTFVTLQASVTTGSTFGGWSGCTSSSGTTCNVTMNASKSVTATFNLTTHTVSVAKTGTGTGGVTSSPGGIACGATCSNSFNYGTSLTLTAVAQPGSFFAGWTGVAGCGTNPMCTFTVTTAINPSAAFTAYAPNIVFVTSTTHDGNLGGLAGADAICQARATAASLSGTYVAWLSSTTTSAVSRLGSARGWVRRDGKPVVDATSDLTSGHLFYPIRLDENGNDVGNAAAFTGTQPNGSVWNTGTYSTCSDWTYNMVAGAGMVGGPAHANSSAFTHPFGFQCNATARLYCFGVDRPAVVAPPVPGTQPRRAFTSSATWTPGGGIAAADAVCASEATAASLPGTYKALMATTTASAISRFTTAAPALPWARRDNTLITASAATLANAATTFIDAAPNGNAANTQWFGSTPIWTGATSLTAPGTMASTCSDWSSNAAASTGRSGVAGYTQVSSWLGNSISACNSTFRVVCLQE